MHRQQRQSAETNPQREVGRGDGRAYHSRWAEGDRGEEGRCFSSPLAALRVAWWWWREGGGAVVVFVRGSRVGWTRASPPRHLFGRNSEGCHRPRPHQSVPSPGPPGPAARREPTSWLLCDCGPQGSHHGVTSWNSLINLKRPKCGPFRWW